MIYLNIKNNVNVNSSTQIAASNSDRGGRQVQRARSSGAEGFSRRDRGHPRPGEAPGWRRQRQWSQSGRPGSRHRGQERVSRHAAGDNAKLHNG